MIKYRIYKNKILHQWYVSVKFANGTPNGSIGGFRTFEQALAATLRSAAFTKACQIG